MQKVTLRVVIVTDDRRRTLPYFFFYRAWTHTVNPAQSCQNDDENNRYCVKKKKLHILDFQQLYLLIRWSSPYISKVCPKEGLKW